MCVRACVRACMCIYRQIYPPKMTANAMNEWYEKILELSKEIGEHLTLSFHYLYVLIRGSGMSGQGGGS